ncbi:MAG: glycosyltransferase family 4 protein [Planctomycetaceae bacterium]|nr:glycosyltransferase family 4 protein [Planctomycetaceae bacterium]
MHFAIVTAGGAGMYCGSCMHDNFWARALIQSGMEVTLVPLYTPLKLDEVDQSHGPIFFGGLNVYLNYHVPGWGKLPRFMTRWLDSAAVINAVTKIKVSNDAKNLGGLTVATLEGTHGPQRQASLELIEYLVNDLKPDAITFSNALLAGVLPELKERFRGPIFCNLQGDDIFIDGLQPKFRERVIALMREKMKLFDGFFVHSGYYRDFMGEMLQIPHEKFYEIPLGLDLEGHRGEHLARQDDEFVIGYFARICPEKGLHLLVEAFEEVRRRHPRAKLKVGGYLGKRDEAYFAGLQERTAKYGEAFEYIGSPDKVGKLQFLQSLHAFSVPTTYREPKGIYVLEALANGVPVVQPAHGAFPELLTKTGGGVLVPPEDASGLAEGLCRLIEDESERVRLAKEGLQGVSREHAGEVLAARSREWVERGLGKGHP